MIDTDGRVRPAAALPRRKLTIVDRGNLAVRAAAPLSATPRPLLRWAGSKQRLLPALLDALPPYFNRYYEPFFGSGALYFLLQPNSAVLGDMCIPLVDFYATIARDPHGVAEAAKLYDPLNRDQYYEVRSNRSQDDVRNAAEFLFLNRACWNGLYRVNSSGKFNVPYGAPKSAAMPSIEHLQTCAERLRSARIAAGDFEATIKTAKAGDLVFLDPPYVTGHNNNGFIDYNETLFSWGDQNRLALVARGLAERGVAVIITNANHEAVLDLYPGFTVSEISRRSTLANNVKRRGMVTEALITSPGIGGNI